MLYVLPGTEKGPWPLAGGFPFDHTPSGDGSSLAHFKETLGPGAVT